MVKIKLTEERKKEKTTKDDKQKLQCREERKDTERAEDEIDNSSEAIIPGDALI